MKIIAISLVVVVVLFGLVPAIGHALLHGDSDSYADAVAIGIIAVAIVMALLFALSAIIWALYQVMP